MSIENPNQYQTLYKEYEWLVPNGLNIAEMCCHRWATNPHEARKTAIYFEDQVGQLTQYSYGQLAEQVTKLARGFLHMGVRPQDKILIITQHSAESAVCLLAALTIGALAVPLPANLTSAQYQARFQDCHARIAIVDNTTIQAVMSAIDNQSPIKQIIGIRTEDERLIQWRSLLARQATHPLFTQTSANTPALMLYADDPNSLEAVVFNHGSLIGSLPGFVCSQNWFPNTDDIFWSNYGFDTPMGITNALLPVLYFGYTLVAFPAGRTMERLFKTLELYQITHVLISAKELSRIQKHISEIDPSQFELSLSSITCLESEITPELRSWVQNQFNLRLTGFISLPIAPYIIGDCLAKWPPSEGAMGRVYPGHKILVLDKNMKPVKTGQYGELYLSSQDIHGYPDPALARYRWLKGEKFPINQEELVATGIRAKIDKDGVVWQAS